MSQQTTRDNIVELVEPALEAMGYELVDLEYRREGRDWILRIFIDREGGVTLDDCVAVSRDVGALLEVEDPIRSAYRLEISSPGIDRPLKKPNDFERFKGRTVKVKTIDELDPDGRGYTRKTFTGELLGLESGKVRIRQTDKKGGVAEISLEQIAAARLEFDF